MKKFQVFLILFLLFSCINKSEERKIEKREGMGKEVQQSKETKYMNLEDFNKKYSYLNQNEAEIQSENRVLVRYIQEKEKRLEKVLEFDQEYIDTDIAKILKNFSTEEEKIIQMIKLIIEFEKNSNNLYFFESILSEEIKYGKKQVLKEFNKTEDKESILLPILEKNFTEEEIRIFFDLYYKNIEFDNYEIAGRYGLKKVDKVIEEVEKIEGLSEEEFATNMSEFFAKEKALVIATTEKAEKALSNAINFMEKYFTPSDDSEELVVASGSEMVYFISELETNYYSMNFIREHSSVDLKKYGKLLKTSTMRDKLMSEIRGE